MSKAGVGLGIVAQKCFVAVQATIDDAMAETKVTLILRPACLDHPRHKLPRGLVSDDQAAVGLAKELKQAIPDPGQKQVQLQRLAEAVAGVQDQL